MAAGMAPGEAPAGAAAGECGTPDDPGKALPIYPHREAILEHVQKHRVTHIQGETGCGKSTQVPKYIMEEAEALRRAGKSDRDTKIVVTQPRRMAAISLAKRCAAEVGEEIGKTVGYKISGDSVSGKLCFATTGFLLQVLVNQPEEFGTYSHIILDEVHERSVDADLLTMLLKLLMQCYPHVKLIVMSATLQAHLFADYFASVETCYLDKPFDGPKLEVKPLFVGVRTFPVEQIYLDELESQYRIEGAQARRALEGALRGFEKGSGKGGGKGKGKGKKGSDKGIAGSASGFKRAEPAITEGLDMLCRELVQQMAREKCTLIVFLPGIADITSFYEALAPLDSTRVRGEAGGVPGAGGLQRQRSWDTLPDGSPKTPKQMVTLRIFPMHSLIPREEQEEVFNAPPKGVCHIVLASNIAESSLTLPSVCAVIDMCLRRSIEYDARRLMSCLVTTWCSQSSCKQRSGRAGRTMPGKAVRMVTRGFFDSMVLFDPPEMLSAPLTKLYLQAKQLCVKLTNMHQRGVIPDNINMDLSTPTHILGEVVQPPATKLVEAAITELADVGALDRPTEDAQITPLGYIAMALPCDLRLCRLLHFGLALGTPCDAIAMVAGLTAADPFSAPSLMVLKDEREYCRKLERSFEARLWCDRGRHSEPLMLRELFVEWINAGAPHGPRAMGGFARDWNVIPKKMEAVTSEAVDIASRLCKMLKPGSSGHSDIQRLLAAMRFHVDRREELVSSAFPRDSEYTKIFCQDVELMRALLAASFSDQIMVCLKPRWEAGGKKYKEQDMVTIMKKQGLDSAGTVVMMQPPQELKVKGDMWETEENHQKLCEAVCGERAVQIHFAEKDKLLFFDFVGKTSKKDKKKGPAPPCGWREEDPVPLLIDAIPVVHRFHQFSAGRWKFNIESPVWLDNGDEDEGGLNYLELIRPIQPFVLNWEVLQHSGQLEDGGMSGAKPTKVKAMTDWRNPIGFACDVRPEEPKPAREHLGVCASVQGLESGASAFVAGTTVLGMNHLPMLLSTLDPKKWNLQWGFDTKTGQVTALRIMHVEINLPPETITEDVLWKVNQLRAKLQEALTPASEDRPRSKGKGKGDRDRDRIGKYINIVDVSEEVAELLEEIWDEPYPVVKSKAVRWGNAAEEHDGEVLVPLQPLAEQLIPVTEQARMTKAQRKAEAKAKAKGKAKAKQPEAKPRAAPKPQYSGDVELWPGQRATFKVAHGEFKGNHKVLVISREETGIKVKHDADGYEEIIKWKHAHNLKGT